MAWTALAHRMTGREPNPMTTEDAKPEDYRSKPYAFYVVALALVLATLVFLAVLFFFGDIFKNAALLTTAMSTLFGVFGTVVCAYFGVKSSSDSADKAQSAADNANRKKDKALAALDPDEAENRGLL